MNGLRSRLLLSITLCLLAWAATAAPIEGVWLTIDDKDGSRKSLVELQVSENGELTGTIIELLQEKNRGLTCDKCPGEFKDKPVAGLTIMWGLEREAQGEWTSGKILDPKSGKVYKAKASLSEDQQELTVRGFIGFSLFGRSQTWIRQPEAE